MRPPDPDALDVFAWNPHTGAKADHIVRILDGQLIPARPDLIVLNEVIDQRSELAAWAKRNGYAHYQEKPRDSSLRPKPTHGATALLVTKRRVDLGELSQRTIAMKIGWTVFSSGTRRAPRRYERVRLLVGDDWRIKFTASHWPTNGFTGGNRLAFAETATRAAAAFVARRPGTTVLDVGDHNESVTTLRKWAKAFGALVAGRGADSIIAAGCDVIAHALAKFGSDHHAMRYTITRN